uniref:Uncharacterized protein n=2 Tax=Oryza TaxID=4527 RepID=A0A0E0ARA2_9ORYZ
MGPLNSWGLRAVALLALPQDPACLAPTLEQLLDITKSIQPNVGGNWIWCPPTSRRSDLVPGSSAPRSRWPWKAEEAIGAELGRWRRGLAR